MNFSRISRLYGLYRKASKIGGNSRINRNNKIYYNKGMGYKFEV